MAAKRLLTPEQVRYVVEVYEKRKALPTYDALAKRYGITEPSVHRILGAGFNPDKTRLALNYEDIQEIKRVGNLRKLLPTMTTIARKWGVSPSTLFDIVAGQTYKNIS